MKQIERKDMPEVSGGWVPPDAPGFPPDTDPPWKDYPRDPAGPLINVPTCPDTAQ